MTFRFMFPREEVSSLRAGAMEGLPPDFRSAEANSARRPVMIWSSRAGPLTRFMHEALRQSRNYWGPYARSPTKLSLNLPSPCFSVCCPCVSASSKARLGGCLKMVQQIASTALGCSSGVQGAVLICCVAHTFACCEHLPFLSPRPRAL
jgi:hypothetical protein